MHAFILTRFTDKVEECINQSAGFSLSLLSCVLQNALVWVKASQLRKYLQGFTLYFFMGFIGEQKGIDAPEEAQFEEDFGGHRHFSPVPKYLVSVAKHSQ